MQRQWSAWHCRAQQHTDDITALTHNRYQTISTAAMLSYRMARPQYSANRVAAQRNPPSWLEGATRDSDPPASARRHRLALSSHQQQQQRQQQQTLPQALNAWSSSQAGPRPEQQHGSGISTNGHAQPGTASVAAADGSWNGGGPAAMTRVRQIQRSRSAQRLRYHWTAILHVRVQLKNSNKG